MGFHNKYCLKKNILLFYIILLQFSNLFSEDNQCCNYDLKPGDGIKISIYPNTDHFINGIYKISSEGYADLPIVGCVKVTDRPCDELNTDLKKRYIDYLNFPNIQITPQIRVATVGGFRTPGLYWAHPFDGLWDVVQNAGGPVRSDGIEKIKWVRSGEELSDTLIKSFEKGESLTEMGFKSGDQLTLTIVPERRGIDVFLHDVVPVFSFVLSTLATSASLYLAYSAYQDR